MTEIPQVKSHLILKWEYARQFRILDQNYKRAQKKNYDKKHRVKILPELPEIRMYGLSTEDSQDS